MLRRSLVGFVSAGVFVLGLALPSVVVAATAPSLGAASPYGVAASTYTNSNTPPQTIINGSQCATTQPTTVPISISGSTDTPCNPQVGLDQNAALNNVVDGLNTQACMPISGALNAVTVGSNPPGTFPPGCYETTGAMNITLGTTVTLDATAPGGSGNAWVFRSGGALNSGDNSLVTLANGASAANVFWAPVGLTTLGAFTTAGVPPLAPTFVGTILDAAGITMGHFANLSGRALAIGGTITTDANTITVPVAAATLHVVKVVENAGGGIAVPSRFNMHVMSAGVEVAGSPALGAAAPGTVYTLSSGTFVVSEDANPLYTQSVGGDCTADGSVALLPGDNKICTVTNTFIPAAAPSPALLHVVKLVVNGSGGTAVASSFNVHVLGAGVDVEGSPAAGVAAPGTMYSLSPGPYSVSEDGNAAYVRTFTGDCDASGNVALVAGDDKICTVVNTDIPAPSALAAAVSSGRSGGITPFIGILKVPTPLALPSGPGPVAYNYTVFNVGGQQALVDVRVTDDTCSPLTFLSGDDNGNGKLDVTEQWRYSCSSALLKTTTNTAVATGFGDDTDRTPAIATAITTVAVGSAQGLPNTGLPAPLINVTKVPSRLTPFPFGGGPVTYTYTVTNPGVVPMSNVTVTDNTCAPAVFTSGDINGNGLLDPGEAWMYSCRVSVPVSTRNVATARGNANGFTAIGFAFATVLVEAPGLPNTGLPPYGEGTAESGMLAGFFFLVLASTLAVKKFALHR